MSEEDFQNFDGNIEKSSLIKVAHILVRGFQRLYLLDKKRENVTNTLLGSA